MILLIYVRNIMVYLKVKKELFPKSLKHTHCMDNNCLIKMIMMINDFSICFYTICFFFSSLLYNLEFPQLSFPVFLIASFSRCPGSYLQLGGMAL